MKINQQGITIIEVLIAGGVLVMILGSAITLNRSIVRNQILSQDRTQAQALAAEASEIIRNLRDSTFIDQTVNQYNYFLPASCFDPISFTGQKCLKEGSTNTSLELRWNESNSQWSLISGGETGLDTDADPDGEVILYSLDDGSISDTTLRIKDQDKTNLACQSQLERHIVFCRRVFISPVVYDKSLPPDGMDAGDRTETSVLPNIIYEDPNISSSQPDFTFDALLGNATKLIVEVSWYEYGQSRSVTTTDIITNWKWID